MGSTTTLQERVTINELAQAGWSDRQISQQLGWSPETVRKWRRKGQRQGRAGLGPQMGRPKRGALSSYEAEVRQTLLHWRATHPGWGPVTLHSELKGESSFAGRKIPSVSSIGRLLSEHGLSRAYQRHSHLPSSRAAAEGIPHAVWEMDARGHEYVPQVGVISLIDLNDRYSHVRLLSYPCLVGQQRWQRHPNTEDYQLVLRLAFTDWGLPEQLQVDHGSSFFDNYGKSPFPTRLHLWLLALGVTLSWGRPHQPRDQGMTERSHQLWSTQCLLGQEYQSWEALYGYLQRRRDFLNCQLPCATLDKQPPLQAFPQARHSPRPYRPEWEAQLLDLQRVFDYLAGGRWFRRVSKDGHISLGGQVFSVGRRWAGQQLEITFDATQAQFACLDEAGRLIHHLPPRQLTAEALMGHLTTVLKLPFFQLALPFDSDSQGVVQLCRIITGTTY
jgi:transposase